MAAITKNRFFFNWPKLLYFKPEMLKISSLCLYSSNLGTFWLKIEQFWPFEKNSIFSNGIHLGYRTALTDKILIKKNSSPLKLLSQSQPNFAEMILGWSPFKILSVSAVLYPRLFLVMVAILDTGRR
jgi:hypothetical protein